MVTDSINGTQWTSASRSFPCPICGRKKFCGVTRSQRHGPIANCTKVETGSFKRSKTGFIHKLNGDTVIPLPTPSSGKARERADDGTRHRVYSALLSFMSLTGSHRAALLKRGLSADAIARYGYRSLNTSDKKRIIERLRGLFTDDVLLSVPGIIMKGEPGHEYMTLALASGIFIPVRTRAGNIIALKLRRDKVEDDETRYFWFSSKTYGGPSCGAHCHVTLETPEKNETVRVIEGPLKGDIVTDLTRFPTIAIPGTSSWEIALPILAAMECKTVRIAFDADFRQNEQVRADLKRFASRLRKEGYSIELEVWNIADGKGLDDLLAAGHKPTVLSGDDARREIDGGSPPQPEAETEEEAGNGKTFQNYKVIEVKVEGEEGKTKKVKIGLPIQELVANLQGLSGGWPKRVDGLLFAEGDRNRPLWMDGSTKLFAWIARQLPDKGPNALKWEVGPSRVSQGCFHAGVAQMAERYRAVEMYPHYPPIKDHYYMHPAPEGGDGKALAKLRSYFKPATPEDADLILAFLLSLFWGGAPGQRPAWLFTGDPSDPKGGRGIGKTTIPKIGAHLVGGHIDLASNEKMADIITRMLSPDAMEKRVVFLDNLKTLKFSWAELESLITLDNISGRRLYVGEGSRPNTLTFVMTMNGGALSKDLAQRVITIQLKRPTFDGDWEKAVASFVEANRWAIVGDIMAILRGDPVQAFGEFSRWGAWEEAVLSRVSAPSECRQLILSRQDDMDDDSEESALVRDQFIAELKKREHNPDADVVLLSSSVIAQWIEMATGEKRPTNKASGYLKTLSIAELRKSDRGEGRGWVWRGKESRPGQSAQKLNDGTDDPFRGNT